MKKTLIIAEAGVNHNGSIEMAREMVRVAALAGADYIKFQTAVPELVISRYAPKAEYQKETTGVADSQLEMCKAIHLPLSAYADLADLCEYEGIAFMSTPFDFPSIECLKPLSMQYWKIPSGEITNLPYLRKIAEIGEDVILSTGMSQLEEVKAAIDILCANGLSKEQITLLHCTTQYPTAPKDVNLRAMDTLRTLGCRAVGYSDHTEGIEISLAAAAMGAEVIEKHFTLDKTLPGPDHKASIDAAELKALVTGVRKIDAALGSATKSPAEGEIANIAIARRSIVAARAIAKGELLTAENLEVKRPGTGISPMRWDEVIGTCAIKDFDPDELIIL